MVSGVVYWVVLYCVMVLCRMVLWYGIVSYCIVVWMVDATHWSMILYLYWSIRPRLSHSLLLLLKTIQYNTIQLNPLQLDYGNCRRCHCGPSICHWNPSIHAVSPDATRNYICCVGGSDPVRSNQTQSESSSSKSLMVIVPSFFSMWNSIQLCLFLFSLVSGDGSDPLLNTGRDGI
jgi:hypothetical protein